MTFASLVRLNLSTYLLIAPLALALFLLWSIHADSPEVSSKSNLHLWQQPLALASQFPEPISTDYWRFDFEASVQFLANIKYTEIGDIILNANSAKTLEDAVSKLPQTMTKTDLHRAELLVTKNFPGQAGQQLAKVLTSFYRYQQASMIETDKPQDMAAKERRFEQTILRQQRYLGKEVANKLFGRQNAVTRYLHARQQINKASNLTQEQKQQQLTTLQGRFKANEL